MYRANPAHTPATFLPSRMRTTRSPPAGSQAPGRVDWPHCEQKLLSSRNCCPQFVQYIGSKRDTFRVASRFNPKWRPDCTSSLVTPNGEKTSQPWPRHRQYVLGAVVFLLACPGVFMLFTYVKYARLIDVEL